MEKLKIYQVDSFTNVPFKGNPAGVCISNKAISDETMQSIAAEMNLSETAFAVPSINGDISSQNTFALRWFTPTVEVDLCGHATLATAKVLFDEYQVETDRLNFATKSGELLVSGKGDKLSMDFPVDLTDDVDIPRNVLDALGLDEIKSSRRGRRMGMILIEVSSPEIVERLKPDFAGLLLHGKDFESFIVTAHGGESEYDFISRFFAPKFGINEDPVTGAAHTALGPYWAQKLGKKELKAYQASARGGEMKLVVKDERIELIGQAVIVMEGEIMIS